PFTGFKGYRPKLRDPIALGSITMSTLVARDLMTRDIVSISPDASIIDAARLMLKHHITGLPVIAHDGRLAGIISEGDLLRRGDLDTAGVPEQPVDHEVLRQYRKAFGQTVAEVMSDQVASVLENTPLAEIARLLQLMGLKRVPVIHRGRVVGI